MLLTESAITFQDLLIYVVSGLFSLLILGIMISMATQVNKRNRLQLLTLEILCKIAEKQGVEKDEIITIISRANT